MPKPATAPAESAHTKTARRKAKEAKPKKCEKVPTTEVDAFLRGLFTEFSEQVCKYHHLTGQLLELEARVELTEKNLRVTRDHFALAVERAAAATLPKDWTAIFQSVEFVGMRLADACVKLLKEKKRMTPDELLHDLNVGMFRFRTNTPLREIHAALLRHPSAHRDEQHWTWTGTDEKQMSFSPRFRTIMESIGRTPIQFQQEPEVDDELVS